MKTNRFWFVGISFLLFSSINSVCFFLITSIDGIGFTNIRVLEIFTFPFFFCVELLGFSFLIKRRIYILFPLLVLAIKALIILLGDKIYYLWWDIIVFLTIYFSFLFNIGQYYIQAHHVDFNFGIIELLFHTVGMFLYQAAIIFLAIKITACSFPALSLSRRSSI